MYRILIISSAGGLLVRSDDTCVESTGAGGLWLYYDKTTFVPDQRITVSCFSEGYLEGEFWVIGDTKVLSFLVLFESMLAIFNFLMFLFQGRTIAITNSPSPTLTMGGEPTGVTIAEGVQSVKLNKAAVPAASIFITMNTFTEKMRQVSFFPMYSSQMPVELNRVLTCQTPIFSQIFN